MSFALSPNTLVSEYYPYSSRQRPSLSSMSIGDNFEPRYSSTGPRVTETNSSRHNYVFDIPGEGAYTADVAESRKSTIKIAFEVREGVVQERKLDDLLAEMRDAKAREHGFDSFAARQEFARRERVAREAAIAEERELATQLAQEAAKALNLPALTGSPKQIAWAEVLREAAVRTLTRTIGKIQQELTDKTFAESLSDKTRASAARYQENMAFVLLQSEAKFFIENRVSTYSFQSLTAANARESLTSYRGNQQGAQGART